MRESMWDPEEESGGEEKGTKSETGQDGREAV
jgi:hypothetical protein